MGRNAFIAALAVLTVLFSLQAGASGFQGQLPDARSGTDDRPPLLYAVHSIGELATALMNNGMWGDPWASGYPTMEWPEGSDSHYLFVGDIGAACYVSIAPDSTPAKWLSITWSPSEGYPMEYVTPGPVAPEESHYGFDDWDPEVSDDPMGIGVHEENYSWDLQGYDSFVATELVVTHHSEYGNPGVPLDGFVLCYRLDLDVASATGGDFHLDDNLGYDGHAVWANGPVSFEYVFDDGTKASEQDLYTFGQNPDNPLPSGDPDNIWYYYNYLGSDGIPDNDVDQNGVSDHFTILAKVTASGDTLYRQDPESGVTLFDAGMPYWHFTHTVGDTTYLVVPRNLSYMWDGDDPGSGPDDSGDPGSTPPLQRVPGLEASRCVDSEGRPEHREAIRRLRRPGPSEPRLVELGG